MFTSLGSNRAERFKRNATHRVSVRLKKRDLKLANSRWGPRSMTLGESRCQPGPGQTHNVPPRSVLPIVS